MSQTNKEILDRLTEYLSTQDMRIVCRALANALLDTYRLQNLETLPNDELDRLFIRIQLNADSFKDFAVNGPKGKFESIPLNPQHNKGVS